MKFRDDLVAGEDAARGAELDEAIDKQSLEGCRIAASGRVKEAMLQ